MNWGEVGDGDGVVHRVTSCDVSTAVRNDSERLTIIWVSNNGGRSKRHGWRGPPRQPKIGDEVGEN